MKDRNIDSKKRKMSLVPAIIVFVVICAAIAVQKVIFDGDMGAMFLMLWVVLIPFGMFYGFKASELEDIAVKFTAKSLPAVFIMLSVGALIGTWIAAGTTPAVIYYGIKFINPKFFLVTAIILCSIISLLSGTSLGSVGTAGVAMMGIGNSLGIPAPVTAGACICGAFLGDKMSPMSDTTILASSICGVNIFKHIRHMVYDQVPSYLITLIFFFVLGFKYGGNIDSPEVNAMMEGLQGNFKLGIMAFLPLLVTIVLLLKKVSATLCIIIGSVMGIAVAVFYQGMDVAASFNTFYSGFTLETENEMLFTLLNRGGISSMWSLVGVTLFGFTVAGMLDHMDVLKCIADSTVKHIHGTAGVTFLTILFGFVGNAVAMSQNFAIVMSGTLMAPLYKRYNMLPKNCSRDLEAGGTYGALFIPWNTNALFCAGALGVSVLSFIPYIPLLYITPVVVIIYSITKFHIDKIYEDEDFVDVSERLEKDHDKQNVMGEL